MLDYELLRIIWWLLIGVLLIGFAITDGFDLGVASVLRLTGRTDIERRVIINTVGPFWEGNQVWLILGGGAIFAAWPMIYAVTFSGFYIAMLVVLLSLILRPVSFKFRSKLNNPLWRNTWDWLLVTSGVVPALIFGVAIGNVIQGVPFHFDDDLRIFYTGTFWQLLNPFALLCGLISLSMIIMHGCCYLVIKTDDEIQKRAKKISRICSVLVVLLYAIASYWVIFFLTGYEVTSVIDTLGPSNPLYKTAITAQGAWVKNFNNFNYAWLVPFFVIISCLYVFFFANRVKGLSLFAFSSLAIMMIIATFGVGMFPFILPSASNPSMSLLVWDASSSKLTLMMMSIVTVIFMPIILCYTAWVYRVLRGKVTVKQILDDNQRY